MAIYDFSESVAQWCIYVIVRDCSLINDVKWSEVTLILLIMEKHYSGNASLKTSMLNILSSALPNEKVRTLSASLAAVLLFTVPLNYKP